MKLQQILGSFQINMEVGLELPKPDGAGAGPQREAKPAQLRCKWVAAFPNKALLRGEAADADFPPLTLLWEDASGACVAAVSCLSLWACVSLRPALHGSCIVSGSVLAGECCLTQAVGVSVRTALP